MDSHKYQVTLNPSQIMGTEQKPINVIADDVLTAEGFVLFVTMNNDGNGNRTVAMFNQNFVQSVMEVSK